MIKQATNRPMSANAFGSRSVCDWQALLLLSLGVLISACAHVGPTADGIAGRWVIDPDATERALIANPPGRVGVGWGYVGLLCATEWLATGVESLEVRQMSGAGDPVRYVLVDREAARYKTENRNPGTVIVRRVGPHLSVQDESGGLVLGQVRWMRVSGEALRSPESRTRHLEECLTGFQRAYEALPSR